MSVFGDRFLKLAGCLVALLWTLCAFACNVPVFRYALERWEADPYEIVVFHDQPFTKEEQALLAAMENKGQDHLANLAVLTVELAGEMSPSHRMLWNAKRNPTRPWMVVRYPRQMGIEQPAWAGPLSAEAVGALMASPARLEIVQNVLRGDAIVWLLLESGDARRDDEVGLQIETEIRKLEQSLVLPEQSPLDPPINSELPLKIAFSTVRLARTNPAEHVFMNLLLNWNTNLSSITEPMLFPIFGRCRVVPPAIGEQIQPEAIRDLAEFLTGPCSCEVKLMNPGYDLLVEADWSRVANGQEGSLAGPPPLIGMSQFAAAAAAKTTSTLDQPAVSFATSAPAPAPVARHHLIRNLGVALGFAVVFLVAATLLLKVKAGRRAR